MTTFSTSANVDDEVSDSEFENMNVPDEVCSEINLIRKMESKYDEIAIINQNLFIR